MVGEGHGGGRADPLFLVVIVRFQLDVAWMYEWHYAHLVPHIALIQKRGRDAGDWRRCGVRVVVKGIYRGRDRAAICLYISRCTRRR